MRKFIPPKGRQKTREARNFKNFVENDFIHNVSQLPWDIVYHFVDPNICWQVWKSLLIDAPNRHAPICRKRISNNPVPWINPQIEQLNEKKDYRKKQAVKHNSETQWALYKAVRDK